MLLNLANGNTLTARSKHKNVAEVKKALIQYGETCDVHYYGFYVNKHKHGVYVKLYFLQDAQKHVKNISKLFAFNSNVGYITCAEDVQGQYSVYIDVKN